MNRDDRQSCPKCGAPDYLADDICVSCGFDLLPPTPKPMPSFWKRPVPPCSDLRGTGTGPALSGFVLPLRTVIPSGAELRRLAASTVHDRYCASRPSPRSGSAQLSAASVSPSGTAAGWAAQLPKTSRRAAHTRSVP
jgi:hypothetical protein